MNNRPHKIGNSRKVYASLFFFSILVSLLTSGGRLASSDELAAYLTTESLAERGELAISPDLVKNGIYGRDGKFYYGVGLAQPVLSAPLYFGGKLAAGLLGIHEPLRTFTVKAAVSLLNQVFAGLIAVVMFAFGVKLGYSRRLSLFLTLGLLFTTNLFPYLKSYMREPQLVFYLLAACYYLYVYKLEGRRSTLMLAGIFCGLGLLTRLTSVITIPILCLYLLSVLWNENEPVSTMRRLIRGSLDFGIPIILAIIINMYYNYAQFGSVTGTPYAAAEFTTPVWVGLYGFLFSSGKSLFLYAPLTILAVASLSRFGQQHWAEMLLFVALVIVNLLFFAKFVAWAGDGSWGPRYLIPILPFLILPCGVLLQSSRTSKRVAMGLAVIGLIIQIGGVSIYLGNYLREIGEYPYTKEFNDPEFMHKSHFIPNYSPVVGHWRMLIRNSGLALSGEKPKLAISDTNSRIPLSEETKSNLLYTLDFWFMYAWYAGIRPPYLIVATLVMLTLTVVFGFRTMKLLSTNSPIAT
jgi:hypothetical protein